MDILIKGAGDMASGCAHKLHNCGWRIIMTELPQPTAVRRGASFCRAMDEGRCQVEGVFADRGDEPEEIRALLDRGMIAVTPLAAADILAQFQPQILVDAVLAKYNTGTRLDQAPLVIGLGPGFFAGRDCHAVVETCRGHDLGRVIYHGGAAANTGQPGLINGYGEERVLRAPEKGIFLPCRKIGDMVEAGETVATVNGQPIMARLSGVVRGLLPAGAPVTRGMKSGDVDPRGRREYCYTISDKARCVAGGVVEAALAWGLIAPL